MSTVHDHVADARRRLRLAGIAPDEAALDARLLAQHVLGWDATRLMTSGADGTPESFADRYEMAVTRRAQREPLAYITGTRAFWDLTVEVSPAVLIPRPETEILVEAALERMRDVETPRVADVCTGSGCIGVAIAHDTPRARVVATDTSAEALAVARRNAVRAGVAGRVACVRTDLLNGVAGRFDVIVSNPPYVPDGDRPRLQPEVRDFEPPSALFAGRDGLDVLNRLVAQAATRLHPGGFLLFEFGEGQAAGIRELIARAPALTMVDVRSDLQGIPRVAVATARAEASTRRG